jgi:hypothetical protein
MLHPLLVTLLHLYYFYSCILYAWWCDEVVVNTWAVSNLCGVDDSWDSLRSPKDKEH